MKVCFRVDASLKIGTGHVMRCLTLAEEMKKRKVECFFICKNTSGNLISLIESKGYNVEIIDYKSNASEWEMDLNETVKILKTRPKKVDLLILDHYQLNEEWEKGVRPLINKLLVIDDFANRKHVCDILLDQTYNRTANDYTGLIHNETTGLFGIKYTLLRPQFLINKKQKFEPSINYRIHIFFGGNDVNGYTNKFTKLILENISDVSVEIVVGESFLFLDELLELKKNYNSRVVLHKNVLDMARTMRDCDIAVGAPGTATWERACIGLPSAYLSTNTNQNPIINQLSKSGFCEFFGDASEITKEEFIHKMKQFINNRRKLEQMFNLNTRNVDGLGTERVVMQLIHVMRK